MIDLTIFEDSFSSVTILVLDRTSAFLAWKSGLLKSTFAVSGFVGVVLGFLTVWFLFFVVVLWETFRMWENHWKFFNPEICFKNIFKFEKFHMFTFPQISNTLLLFWFSIEISMVWLRGVSSNSRLGNVSCLQQTGRMTSSGTQNSCCKAAYVVTSK